VTIVSLSLVVSAGAFARGLGAPPAGRYACTVASNAGVAGNLRIVDGSHYRMNTSKVGVYAVKGRNLTFPSGIFHGVFKARWSVSRTKRAEIVFTSLRNGLVTEKCSWKGKK
jgi:hypothetical protein